MSTKKQHMNLSITNPYSIVKITYYGSNNTYFTICAEEIDHKALIQAIGNSAKLKTIYKHK